MVIIGFSLGLRGLRHGSSCLKSTLERTHNEGRAGRREVNQPLRLEWLVRARSGKHELVDLLAGEGLVSLVDAPEGARLANRDDCASSDGLVDCAGRWSHVCPPATD